jgi:hypothetical protein
MPSPFESRTMAIAIVILVLFILTAVVWFYYFRIASPPFNRETAVVIHDAVIQGISGLGSVAIAVIIFRIQSLENRNASLEQSTLNYISQTLGWSYPKWTSSLEDDIKSKVLTDRYYAHLPSRSAEIVTEERGRQQKRLEEALDLHTRIQKTIRRIRRDVFSCAVFLILPIMLSLLLLLVTDLLDIFWNFITVSAVVLMCSLGILLLIRMVLGSTVKES